MGQLRRYEIAVCLLAVLAACTSMQQDSNAATNAAAEGTPEGKAVALSVMVENGAPPGVFSVTNQGPDILLRRQVLVEQQASGSWTAAEAEVRLIASCDEAGMEEPLALAQGETLAAAPWNGYSCGGQCPGSCRANVYLGPGSFRFVVFSADEGQRFEGPAFELGAASPAP